jgi:hypothetical protein
MWEVSKIQKHVGVSALEDKIPFLTKMKHFYINYIKKASIFLVRFLCGRELGGFCAKIITGMFTAFKTDLVLKRIVIRNIKYHIKAPQ